MRPVQLAELETYYPAAVAMFTEEVGVDPRWPDGGAGYHARVEELIKAGRSFARFEGDRGDRQGRDRCALLAGRPDPGCLGCARVSRSRTGRPGCGVSGPVHPHAPPDPSLYVNHHNTPARAAYKRIGFRQVGTFASVLF